MSWRERARVSSMRQYRYYIIECRTYKTIDCLLYSSLSNTQGSSRQLLGVLYTVLPSTVPTPDQQILFVEVKQETLLLQEHIHLCIYTYSNVLVGHKVNKQLSNIARCCLWRNQPSVVDSQK
ncbi:hypothetical protein J6590_030013 [Homalodisca vitripennis]|nr:hypothetical protein J6590_030013 [Homalodisca vitripennis]